MKNKKSKQNSHKIIFKKTALNKIKNEEDI